MSGIGYDYEQTSAEAIALPIVSGIAIVIMVAPFIVQYRSHNVGQCAQIFYITLANLITFMNAIIWPNFNYLTWWNGSILCDIQVKLKYPYITGVACATLCVTRRLAIAVDPNKIKVSETRRQRMRATFEDVTICCFIPLLQVALHYVIQFNRYYITAVGGCTASYDNSWPTIVIMFVWPLIFCILNCYYSVLIIHRLRQYRAQVVGLLGGSNTNLTMFLRLLFNSLLIVLVYTPVTIYFFYANVNIIWLPYDWDLVHSPETWGKIVYLPDIPVAAFNRWVFIIMAFFCFFFFGMGAHAMETYRGWGVAIGLGKCLPGLNEEKIRGRNGSVIESTWLDKFSLIGRARNYFQNIRKTSTFGSIATDTIKSRKSSLNPDFAPNIVFEPSQPKRGFQTMSIEEHGSPLDVYMPAVPEPSTQARRFRSLKTFFTFDSLLSVPLTARNRRSPDFRTDSVHPPFTHPVYRSVNPFSLSSKPVKLPSVESIGENQAMEAGVDARVQTKVWAGMGRVGSQASLLHTGDRLDRVKVRTRLERSEENLRN